MISYNSKLYKLEKKLLIIAEKQIGINKKKNNFSSLNAVG